jgi:hypothetical protein
MTIEGQRIQVLDILLEVSRAASKCEPVDCYTIARDVLLVLREQLDLWRNEEEPEQPVWNVMLGRWLNRTDSDGQIFLDKIGSIKAVRNASMLLNINNPEVIMGLKVAKDLVESNSPFLFTGIKKSIANDIVRSLASCGVSARVERECSGVATAQE